MKTGNDESADELRRVAGAHRDPREFGALYEQYVGHVYRYVYRCVGNHVDAEDVTARTFQHALAALPNHEWCDLPFDVWPYRIAGNVIVRRECAGGRDSIVEDAASYAGTSAGSVDDPPYLPERDAASEELVAAIRQLLLNQQRVIVLRFARGLRNREIGDAMSRSEGAIRQLVHGAMLTLRASLEGARDG